MTDMCRQFDSLLIDLAYGELPDSRAEELRIHADQCATCRAALEEIMLVRKLATQLPTLEPANSMDALILDAATAAADQYANQRISDPAPETTGPGLPPASIDKGPSFQERLRAFLLSPALATAAVVALVLVISFFLVQKGPFHEKQVLEEGRIAFEAPIPESAPMVLQDKDDAEEGASLKEEVAPLKPLAGKAEERRAAPSRTAPQSAPRSGNGLGATPKRKSAQGSRYRADYLGSAEPAPETSKQKKTAAIQPSSSAKRGKNAKQMPSLVDDAANGFALGEAEDVSSGQGALQAEATPSKQTQFGPYTSDFRMGEEAYARGDCKTATSALLRVVNQPSAHPAEAAYATHHIGACEKRRGRCGKAIVWYEQLFAGYPNYKNRAVALREASICYRRLGQPKKAQAMLDQLNRIMPDMEQLD